MNVKWAVLGALVFSMSAGAGAKTLMVAPGVSFSGAPTYLSDFPTTFRDNGGPLSPYGSHFGLKAKVDNREFAGVLHFACATGKTILDYSRTGLAAESAVRFKQNGAPVPEALERKLAFEYYGWIETAKFANFLAEARVSFLGIDQYLISVRIQNPGAGPISLTPVFTLTRKGKQLAAEKADPSGLAVFRFAVQPTLWKGENYLAIAGSNGLQLGAQKSGTFELSGNEIQLAAGESKQFWFIFGYSPDRREVAVSLAQKARENFPGPEAAYTEMQAKRDRLFSALPPPHLSADRKDYRELYLMAATALENALYAPRGKMHYWACVPTKVHYNWFWLWDSGFEALGYSEFMPEKARDVILSIFQMQRPDGFIAHMEDEREEGLTPHSQSPVFGLSVSRLIAQHPEDPGNSDFRKVMYEKGALYIKWWKAKRDVNHNGLYEYISQDEGGWDNSPRADYVPRITFISYYGTLGELIGSKVKPLDNVDLNAWMFLYFQAMGDWAEELGKPAEAKAWRDQARDLAQKIDAILWDPENNCWLDTYNWIGSKKYHHYRVLTPHIWFPAFAGATQDEKKARAVIEKHLLNPDEFFGKYPIPIVAYNDPSFTREKSGWYGSIWIVTAYTALEALFKFGYEAEAQELKDRLLSMMASQKDGMKGIYETYDPLTGQYKTEYSDGGYASFQFGWSSAFTLEMILDRYQEERFVFADTQALQGFIRRAPDFQTREPFYRVAAGRDAPKLELSSVDGKPLLEASSVKLKLSDPFQALPAGNVQVWIKGKLFEVEINKEYALPI